MKSSEIKVLDCLMPDRMPEDRGLTRCNEVKAGDLTHRNMGKRAGFMRCRWISLV